MSVAARVRGTLRYESEAALAAAIALDEADEYAAEVGEIVRAAVKRDGATLTIDLDASLTNTGNLELQTWLEDVVESAIEGHLDTWQDDFGDEMFVRLGAGGDETEVKGPFPAP